MDIAQCGDFVLFFHQTPFTRSSEEAIVELEHCNAIAYFAWTPNSVQSHCAMKCVIEMWFPWHIYTQISFHLIHQIVSIYVFKSIAAVLFNFSAKSLGPIKFNRFEYISTHPIDLCKSILAKTWQMPRICKIVANHAFPIYCALYHRTL